MAGRGELPEIRWEYGDDLCDCTFQRIGFWTNPYIARTLEIRMCCMWAKLNEMFPGLMREIPAFTDYNHGDVFITEPTLWNGEHDMPVHLWHRQIATITGMGLPEIREKFAGQSPPKGVARDKADRGGVHDSGRRTSVEPERTKPASGRSQKHPPIPDHRGSQERPPRGVAGGLRAS